MVKRQPSKSANFFFTSESVCAGHPDKICDQVSDAIVDEVLAQDKRGRAAIETLVTTNKVFIAGEVKTFAKVNFEKIARSQIKRLGYTNKKYDFTDKSEIQVFVHEQSPEIALGVDKEDAGDQGMMFGYACEETKELMPLSISLAHDLAKKIDQVRENGLIKELRPDGKTQVTVEYKNGKPYRVDNVVVAVPHHEKVDPNDLKQQIFKQVVLKVLKTYGFSLDLEKLIVNGTGLWYIGGPASDTGLTGRKIVVDTYGGYARVGGGCFSGKDPTKVDRSGAYAARYIAKNIVANKLAEKAEVRLAYVIGQQYPLMQDVETFGTAKVSPTAIRDFVKNLLDTSVYNILEQLNLRAPIYLQTASYGHFGRKEFPWEKVKRV